ncbi:hypothetical protein TEA_014015 [Camellia sinensis var. sinensis]|uniref:Uncharacterized protein n=1 Tax=Camellia sinensis var. sinensis TaxID=542762 RepID=A0A4S4EFB9_CAMSN|nr:hypothetical protein TEA_014015 [Camellia sinensis var. sinensis]
MEISHKNSLLFLVLAAFSAKLVLFCSADPIDGFTLVPLTEKNFGLQKPYNVPLDNRYSYEDGVRRLCPSPVDFASPATTSLIATPPSLLSPVVDFTAIVLPSHSPWKVIYMLYSPKHTHTLCTSMNNDEG